MDLFFRQLSFASVCQRDLPFQKRRYFFCADSRTGNGSSELALRTIERITPVTDIIKAIQHYVVFALVPLSRFMEFRVGQHGTSFGALREFPYTSIIGMGRRRAVRYRTLAYPRVCGSKNAMKTSSLAWGSLAV